MTKELFCDWCEEPAGDLWETVGDDVVCMNCIDHQDDEPEIDDSVQMCSNCERAQQFSGLCNSCLREESEDAMCEGVHVAVIQ